MKAIISAFALLLLLNGMQVSAGHAPGRSQGDDAVRLLRALRQNALDAGSNVGIYQWKRVNRETDRIAADARKFSALPAPAMPPGQNAQQAMQDLQQAAHDLREARLQRDAVQMDEAAHRLAAACDTLLALK